MATAYMNKEGAQASTLMEVGGWKSPQMVARYSPPGKEGASLAGWGVEAREGAHPAASLSLSGPAICRLVFPSMAQKACHSSVSRTVSPSTSGTYSYSAAA